MDFFNWQGVGGVHGEAMDDERNAARRKKTRSHGMLWLGIGINLALPSPVRPKSLQRNYTGSAMRVQRRLIDVAYQMQQTVHCIRHELLDSQLHRQLRPSSIKMRFAVSQVMGVRLAPVSYTRFIDHIDQRDAS